MGSGPAPFLANLFLYYYENKWITKIDKANFERARCFSNIFRFINDLAPLKASMKIIFPELELDRKYSEH